jgi:hypothetical protein
VEEAASAPQAAWWLIAVCPHVAELLATVILGEVTRGFVHLFSYGNMTEACQLENALGLLIPMESNKEGGSGTLADF